MTRFRDRKRPAAGCKECHNRILGRRSQQEGARDSCPPVPAGLRPVRRCSDGISSRRPACCGGSVQTCEARGAGPGACAHNSAAVPACGMMPNPTLTLKSQWVFESSPSCPSLDVVTANSQWIVEIALPQRYGQQTSSISLCSSRGSPVQKCVAVEGVASSEADETADLLTSEKL